MTTKMVFKKVNCRLQAVRKNSNFAEFTAGVNQKETWSHIGNLPEGKALRDFLTATGRDQDLNEVYRVMLVTEEEIYRTEKPPVEIVLKALGSSLVDDKEEEEEVDEEAEDDDWD